MRERFTFHRFNASSRELIDRANEIISEYQGQGFTLTLRQLFYQFVARGYLENTLRGYARVCTAMRNGRDAGEIDWEAIEDRLRVLQELCRLGHTSACH